MRGACRAHPFGARRLDAVPGHALDDEVVGASALLECEVTDELDRAAGVDQYRRPGVGLAERDAATGEGDVVGVVDERGSIQRFRAPGSVENPLPNIPSDVPAEEVADWVARQKNVEGPEAGLGNIKVTKEQVQRND